jgi:hypothetical protein
MNPSSIKKCFLETGKNWHEAIWQYMDVSQAPEIYFSRRNASSN